MTRNHRAARHFSFFFFFSFFWTPLARSGHGPQDGGLFYDPSLPPPASSLRTFGLTFFCQFCPSVCLYAASIVLHAPLQPDQGRLICTPLQGSMMLRLLLKQTLVLPSAKALTLLSRCVLAHCAYAVSSPASCPAPAVAGQPLVVTSPLPRFRPTACDHRPILFSQASTAVGHPRRLLCMNLLQWM